MYFKVNKIIDVDHHNNDKIFLNLKKKKSLHIQSRTNI